MGLGEGIAFPTIQALVASWIPSSSRSRALSTTYGGAQAGTILALLTAPFIVRTFEWPSLFYTYGAAGFVWLAAWALAVSDEPPIAVPGAATTRSGRGRDRDREPLDLRAIDWRAVARNASFRALLIAHMTWATGHYVLLAWLPSFFHSEFDMDLETSAAYALLPWVATFVCTNAGGWIADGLINGGTLTTEQTRKVRTRRWERRCAARGVCVRFLSDHPSRTKGHSL